MHILHNEYKNKMYLTHLALFSTSVWTSDEYILGGGITVGDDNISVS